MNILNRQGRTLAGMAAMVAAAASLLSLTSVTDAAWTDDEHVSTVAGVMVAGDCSTSTLFRTESSARQLSGVLGAENLDSLAALQGLSVENSGGAISVNPLTATQIDPVTFTAPLTASAFDTPLLSASLGLSVPAGEAGAYNQWGRARSSGQSAAAAGAVNDQSGAIDATGTANGSNTMPSSANISLASLVPGSAADMTLDIGAVAGSAELDACLLVDGWPTLNPVPLENRTYGIAGADLSLGAPAVQSMTTAVGSALEEAADDLAAVDNADGQVTQSINSGIAALVEGSTSDLKLGSVNTTIAISALDLSGLPPLTGTISDGVVTIDLTDANVTVDLAALRGGLNGFNGLPPNTVIGMDEALVEVAQRTTALLNKLSADITGALQQALAAATFTMHSEVVLRSDVLLLGTVDVARLTITYGTNLGAFLDGSPLSPTITTEILNGGLTLSGLNLLLTPVVAALMNGTGTVVEGALVPAINGAGGVLTTAFAAIESSTLAVAEEIEVALEPLAGTLALTVNVQPDQPGAPVSSALAGDSEPGEYKISALRIATVDNAAEIYLATASAGPVLFRPEPAG